MIAAAYFFAFAANGLNLPLATPALLQAGFAAAVIGAAVSFRSFLQMFATPLWAAIADAHGSARAMAVRGQLCIAIAMSILAFAHSQPMLILGYFIFGFFGGGSTTLIDSLNIINHGRDKFGAARTFGTIGYALAILLPPPLVQTYVFGGAAVLSLVAALALAFTSHTPRPRVPVRFDTSLLKQRAFLDVVIFSTLQWASHSAFTVFMFPLGKARGVPQGIISLTIIGGLAIEVLALRYCGRIYKRFGARRVFAFVGIAAVVRWGGLALTTDTVSFVVLHCLHGITFGMFYPAAVSATASVSQPEQRVTAQALLTAVGFGLGGALGSALAGVAFEQSAAATWAVMLIPASAATLLVVTSRGIKSLP